MDDEDRPRHLFTAAEAQKVFGISAATIRSWQRRELLWHYGEDEWGHPLFDRDHLLELRRNSNARARKRRGPRLNPPRA